MKRLFPILLLLCILLVGCTNMSTSAIQALQQESYQEGYDEGHEKGFDEGKATGYQNGYQKGYDAGYNDAGGTTGCDDPPPPVDPPPPNDTKVNYIANKNTGKFHIPECNSVDDMKEKNKLYWEGTREELIEKGYEPCGNCNP